MRLAFLSSMIALVLAATPTATTAQTAQQMLSACRALAKANVTAEGVAVPQDFDSGVCWGAFATIQTVIVHVRGEQRLYRVCAPAPSTRTQLVAIFAKYAEDNPRRLHEDFFEVVMDGLRQAFPCPPAR